MPFQTRNAYYLRISASNVIPLYLYLDPRHLEWMNDRILQCVLADLRPLILPKLQAEGAAESSKGDRGTLDVHRGESYQFAYFLRKTEPHSVLVKTRTFFAKPKNTEMIRLDSLASSQYTIGAKRPASVSNTGRKKRKTKGKERARDEDEESVSNVEETEEPALRRSGRSRKEPAHGYGSHYDDEDYENAMDVDESPDFSPPRDAVTPNVNQKSEPGTVHTTTFTLEEDEDETKEKPDMRLTYQGFTIFGNCLCVIAEPWPAIRGVTREPSIAPIFNAQGRTSSIAPPDFVTRAEAAAAGERAKTPLFLPDPDGRDRSVTPAPTGLQRPPVPLFNDPQSDPDDDEDDEDGLMLFSQSIRNAGNARAGSVEVEDDMDGEIMFGDADEAREF